MSAISRTAHHQWKTPAESLHNGKTPLLSHHIVLNEGKISLKQYFNGDVTLQINWGKQQEYYASLSKVREIVQELLLKKEIMPESISTLNLLL